MPNVIVTKKTVVTIIPGSHVSSVAGKIGAVTLGISDIVGLEDALANVNSGSVFTTLTAQHVIGGTSTTLELVGGTQGGAGANIQLQTDGSIVFGRSGIGASMTLDGDGKLAIGSGSTDGYVVKIQGTGSQDGYGNSQLKIESSGSEAGLNLNNTGSGGRRYILFTSSEESGVGAGKFIIGDVTGSASRLTINLDGSVEIPNKVSLNSVFLDNAANLAKGSFDNGRGGSNGISLFCTVGYELNWQAGYLNLQSPSGTALLFAPQNGTLEIAFADDGTGNTGLVLRAPSGGRFLINVGNDGILTTTPL